MSRLQEAKDLLAATEGHTPGPWEAHGPFDDEGPELWWDVFAQPGGSIAHVSQGARGSKEHVKRTKHDATLLAAAPALRDLLAAMVAEVELRRSLTTDLDKLLVCYRTGQTPQGSLLDRIDKTREELAK